MTPKKQLTPHIVVVSADPEIRWLMAIIARREGCEVAEAGTPDEVVRLTSAINFSALLTDSTLPQAVHDAAPHLPQYRVEHDYDLALRVRAIAKRFTTAPGCQI